jgi:tetrapyrrole methylase family protein/MazG family protein
MPTLQDIFSLLELQSLQKLTLCRATTFQDAHIPPFESDTPALLHDVEKYDLDHLRGVLQTGYNDDHPLRLVLEDGSVTNVDLGLLGVKELAAPVRAIFIPPLPGGSSVTSFAEIVAHLRAPDGCPWDKKQTHQSLRKHLLEESYEALDAMDKDDAVAMTEEFGDLLLQILLNAQIGNEHGHFRMSDVVKGIYDKIVRRHPHVFGDENVSGEDEVLQNWEALKAQERKDGGKLEKGILDSVPLSFPALNQAQEYQERAARVGFDWPQIDGVLEKLAEEIEEIQTAETQAELASEIGDLLFVLVNFARWKNVDAESALRETNKRFKARFGYIEQCARQGEFALSDMSLDEMEDCWQEAKQNGL